MLLSQSADAVDHVMGQFDVATPHLPDLDNLIHRLTELRDSQPEPQVAHVLFETPADLADEAPAHAADNSHEEALGASLDDALSDATLPVEHIVDGLRQAVRDMRIVPILCMSALHNIATDQAADFMVELGIVATLREVSVLIGPARRESSR